MKNIIDLVNKSFVGSDELNNKMAKVNELKMQFVSSLNDEQCIEFLKFCVEIGELQKSNRRNTSITLTKFVKMRFR